MRMSSQNRVINSRHIAAAVIFGTLLFFGYHALLPRFSSTPSRHVITHFVLDAEAIPDIHQTVVGPCDTSHPLIKELLNHPAMRRLKYIDQHGALTYFGPNPTPTFNRYDHSIGVFAVLQKKGRPFTEQVAGLLHDVSHTAFSHVADWLYQTTRSVVYQDTIHEAFLTETGIVKLLEKHNLTLTDVSFNLRAIPALKSPRPHLSADRIEYMLHTGIIFSKITPHEAREIFDSLIYDDACKAWYSTDQGAARQIADLALFFSETFWSSPQSCIANYLLAQLLAHALDKKLITSAMLHYGDDIQVLTELHRSCDEQICADLEVLHNRDLLFTLNSTAQDRVFVDFPKFWGVDPLVGLKPGELIPLSELDTSFKLKYKNAEAHFKKEYRFALAR